MSSKPAFAERRIDVVRVLLVDQPQQEPYQGAGRKNTPGHQGLLVDLRDSGPILLATDIAYSAHDYADAAVRTSNVDLDQSRSSIETAKRIEREHGATVWLHHDLEAQRDVRTAPGYYEVGGAESTPGSLRSPA
jgi:glyoxylase-like metal-dependent hydrolase (beta-lactamase superfamily II)